MTTSYKSLEEAKQSLGTIKKDCEMVEFIPGERVDMASINLEHIP